jgi:uncharacterized protein
MEVIIKPTLSCNGTCVYCSADGALDKHSTLPKERLGPLFAILARWLRARADRNLRFTWHGGEPTLCGPEYFAAVVREQRQVFGEDLWRVKNIMQSNLSLVDERWIPYLRELLGDGPIGTSFDIVPGVRGIVGKQSLPEVWTRALRLLHKNGFRVGVVYVVHRGALERTRDLYYFFRNIIPSLSVRFNPLYKQGRGDSESSQDLWISAEEYGRFLVELSNLWIADGRRMSTMPLGEWYRAWRGDFSLCCDSRGACHQTHVGINPDGSVYGCGRASDSGIHRFGNIFEEDFDEILRCRPRSELAGRAAKLQAGACKGCRYWQLCHGGCPILAWLYYRDSSRETYFCAARKRLFEHFEERFGPPAHMRQARRAVLTTEFDS